MKNQSRRAKGRVPRNWKGAVRSRKMDINKASNYWEGVDRISDLPDDILVSVISRLTVAEATATSVLSTRWRHLHKLIHRLVFCPSEQQISRIKKKHPQELRDQIKEFTEYMKGIDGVLDSFGEVGILEEFRVDLPCLRGANMKKWLQFALERKVESIDIHMMINNKTRDLHALMRYGGYYNFPRSTLRNNAPGLESLKQLSLRGVHVEERDVSLFLLSLPGLESLSISFSEKLRKVRALGHSKLKRLYISSCKYVQSVEVGDMNNLASLICPDLGWFDELRYQLMPHLKLNNVPNLTHFEISDRPNQSLIDILPTFPSCIRNQLLHLKLSTNPKFMLLSSPEDYMLYRFQNLKHLELEITMYCYNLACEFIHLIAACPLLENLDIKFVWTGSTLFDDLEPSIFESSPNYHIKRVKISGYLGSPEEIELALYIINKAVAMEELILEPGIKTCKFRVRRRCVVAHPPSSRKTKLSFATN